MEIKNITRADLDKAEERIRERGESLAGAIRLDAEEAIRHFREATAGLELLHEGIGGLLDRAALIYVSTFTPQGSWDGGFTTRNLELRFPAAGYTVPLDANWSSGVELKNGQAYRVLLVVEPVEPIE
jgi:hypothetical protein